MTHVLSRTPGPLFHPGKHTPSDPFPPAGCEDVAVGVEPLAVAVALYKGVDAQEMAEFGVVNPALLELSLPYPLGKSLWLSKLNPVDLPTKTVYGSYSVPVFSEL